jgi:polysaccharide export outer membrane protein
MRPRLTLFICLTLSFFLMSCSNYKKFAYLQDLNHSTPYIEPITNYSPLTIQPEDLLGISISSLSPESSAVFNFSSNTVNGTNENYGGYLVDQNGVIQLPIIGSITVGNLTTVQIKEQIRKKLTAYLKEPVVIVKLLNFKVSIMGDVAQPGVFKVQSERLTLTEALSLAGDLNITALRDIVIVREKNGKREYVTVDMTSKKVFNSPYFYLKNNDLIYVQPSRVKYAAVDQSFQKVSLLLSIISVAAIFLTR